MRRWICVPMIALCLLLCACRTVGTESKTEHLLQPYQEMSGCTMEAEVACGTGYDEVFSFTLKCEYTPEESTVEILEPETVAGVRAVLSGDMASLVYKDLCLNVGTLSKENISPMECLPQLMAGLREGWLLEENREDWQGTPCIRLCHDRTGRNGGKIVTAVWLKQEDGLPLHGEIAVEDEIILTAEFTSFTFCDIIEK